MIRGATVLPVDAAFSQPEAIAVRAGRIVAVGTEAQVTAAAGPGAEVFDRPGAVILPVRSSACGGGTDRAPGLALDPR